MASQSHSIDFVGVQIPAEHRRIHFHAGGEVFNIHEHMMKSMCANWSEWEDELSTDEKGERHYEDKYWPAWTHRVIIFWLYKGVFPDGKTLTQWMGELPKDWTNGSEAHPLACSLAIDLHLKAHARNWFGVADMMTTFLFKEYQEQRLPPSAAKLRHLYTIDPSDEIKELFAALHHKFYDAKIYKAQETRRYPIEFLRDFFVFRASMERFADQLHTENGKGMTSEDVRTRFQGSPPLKLIDHHIHFVLNDEVQSGCAACSTAELRADFTID